MRNIKFECPNPKCGAVLSLTTDMLGRRVRCAACGGQFQVPVTRLVRSAPKRRLRRKAG